MNKFYKDSLNDIKNKAEIEADRYEYLTKQIYIYIYITSYYKRFLSKTNARFGE
jgi:hypothetical protein